MLYDVSLWLSLHLSALDAESERLVQQALDVLQQGNLFLYR